VSIRAISAALTSSSSTGPARAVLIVIAYHAREPEFTCWPSASTIADEAGLSRATVTRAVRNLEALGEIRIRSRGGDGGSNTYVVTLPALAQSEPKSVAQSEPTDMPQSEPTAQSEPRGLAHSATTLAQSEPGVGSERATISKEPLEPSTTPTTNRASLPDQIVAVQAVFAEFGPTGCVLDEISAANAISRFPSGDPVTTAHACAEYLRQHPDRPVGMTFQRFLENEVRDVRKAADKAKPAKRFESERTDFSHYDDLVNG
jgi:AcrR family transcriptional regulator